MTFQPAFRLLIVVGLLASSGSAFAQRRFMMRGSRWQSAMNLERKQLQQAQALMKARAQLTQQEQQALSEAMEQLAAAKQAHRQAGKELTAAREAALKEIESSLGMKRLQDELAAAQSDFKKASEPVLEKLKASPEYIAASKKAAAAKLEIQQLHAETSMNESEKKSKLDSLFNDSMVASNMEQTAWRKDQACSNAHERIEAAQAKVSETRRKALEKLGKDPSVAAAQEAVDHAFAQVKSAEANLAAIGGKAEVAELQLQAGIIPKKPSSSGSASGKSGKKS